MASDKPKKGRPKSETADQYAPLTIRLHNKLRFGLDLLARAQHRSLSQAIEWALKVGLNNYEVGSDTAKLGEVVERAWAEPTEAERLLAVYRLAPSLLPFEDFVACEVVDRCQERQGIFEEVTSRFGPTSEMTVEEFKVKQAESKALQGELESLVARFAAHFWPAIREKALELANQGKSTQDTSLLGLLGMQRHGAPWWGVAERAIAYSQGGDAKEAADKLESEWAEVKSYAIATAKENRKAKKR